MDFIGDIICNKILFVIVCFLICIIGTNDTKLYFILICVNI